MKIAVTKKQLLIAGGVVLLLGGALVFGILSQQLLQKPKVSTPEQTASGLPNELDAIQSLRLQGKNKEANLKADTLLSQASTSDNDKYLLYMDKGNAGLNTKDYPAALDAYQHAAAVQPTANAYELIGQTYFFMGKKSDAKTAYQKAITLIDKNSPVARSYGADLQQRIDAIDGKFAQ